MIQKEQWEKWDKALIIANGDEVPAALPQICDNTYVIAADGGSKWAYKWGITPDLIIGDLDSINPQEKSYWEARQVAFQTFPVEKDQTDLELAVDVCIAKEIPDLTLVGVWGGRVSHSLGNLEVLYKLGERKVRAEFLTKHSRVVLVLDHLHLKLALKQKVSLLPLTERVEGVTTKGLYYPLKDACLAKGQTLGVSNQVSSCEVEISTKQGILVAVIEE